MPSYDEMTQDNFFVLFIMEQTHFQNMPEIDNLINQIESAADSHGAGKIIANRVGKSQTIKLSCNRIELKSDVDAFVDELDFILSLVKVIA